MGPAGVHAAVGDEADEVHARRVLHRGPQDVVLGERPVLDGLADAREVLLDHRAGAEVEVPDLRVAHLALGEPDGRPPRRQLAVRIALPQVVEDRRRGQRDGVARAVRRDPPAVEDDEADRRDGHPRAASTMAAKSATSRDAPPTSAPSTSGRANSSAALSGLTEPPYRIRVRSAWSGSRSATSARTKAIASWACSGVATSPVPMAQIGSYAMRTSPPR